MESRDSDVNVSGEGPDLQEAGLESSARQSAPRRYVTKGGYTVDGSWAYIRRKLSLPSKSLDATVSNLLPAVGGLAAIATGLIYFIGLLTISSELLWARLSLADALPLISLSQILGRGLPGILAIAIIGLIWALTTVITDYNSYIREAHAPANIAEQSKEPERAPQSFSKHRLVPRWFNISLFAALAILLPPRLAVLMLPNAILVHLYTSQKLKPHRTMAPFWASLVLTLALAYIVSTLIWPRPLPDATVFTDKGSTIAGRLISAGGDRIYLGVKGSNDRLTITGISADSAQRLEIAPHPAKETRSLVEVVLDRVRDR